jgi:hypothetical protein
VTVWRDRKSNDDAFVEAVEDLRVVDALKPPAMNGRCVALALFNEYDAMDELAD